jgi:copper homeostasis protein
MASTASISTAATPAGVPFECCADSVESAVAAQAGGAARVELCDGLVDGGVTPSHGKLAGTLAAVTIPVHVLVRPRPGDFCYSPGELAVIAADIAHCKALGAAGVVIGALRPDGSVDMPAMRALVAGARPLRVTFHKAIDVTPDPLAALADCMALGVDYVLTSGGAPTVVDGAPVLKAMVDAVSAAGSATRILAGGGVTAANVAALVAATGVHEVHGSGAWEAHAAVVGRRGKGPWH